MNICFLLDGFDRGGVARVVSILGNALQNNGYSCFALCFTNNGNPDAFSVNFPVTYLFPRSITMREALLKRHYIKTIRKFLKENQIDLLIACGALFFPAAVLSSRKVYCWEHTNPDTGSNYRFQKIARNFGALLSQKNIVLTKTAQKIYQKRYPMKTTVQIYNPVDPVLLQTMPVYHPESKKIISVGRLCEAKDFSRLLDIAVSIPDGWTWDIYGDGPLKEELIQKRDRLHLKEKVFFKGNVSNIYEKYEKYAFFVLTSKYEGFPMVLLEAGARGLPLLAFDVNTGPSEIIQNGYNGYCIPWEDTNGMIHAIKKMTQSDRKEMSKNSRKSVENFSIDHILQQWKKII